VNAEKAKNMVVSFQENVGQYHNLLIANKSFENVAYIVQVLENNRNK
jgi:hypothetical protein